MAKAARKGKDTTSSGLTISTGAKTVFINSVAAATKNAVGEGIIISGEPTVIIEDEYAASQGDGLSRGGVIASGSSDTNIGK